MSKQAILDIIYSIQESFPEELLNKLFFKKINEYNIDDFFSRSLITFTPVYLPIFEKDGDILAVHLEVGKTWEEGAWVDLQHDFEYPGLVSTSFKYLPYALLSSPINVRKYVDEIWDDIKSMLPQELEMPNKDNIEEVISNNKILKSKYDKEHIIAKLSIETGDFFDDEAQDIVEKIYDDNPENIHAIAAFLINRKLLKKQIDVNLAILILSSEYNYPFYSMFWNTANSGLEVLEAIREAVIGQIPADNPLSFLKDCSYTDPDLVDNFKKVANAFNEKGEPLLALNQLRNAASIMGGYGSGITKEWCQLLGEQADRVEKDCLSAKLAYYATEVIDLEP